MLGNLIAFLFCLKFSIYHFIKMDIGAGVFIMSMALLNLALYIWMKVVE